MKKIIIGADGPLVKVEAVVGHRGAEGTEGALLDQVGALTAPAELRRELQGHVTRGNFSCNLQRNKDCIAICERKQLAV